VPESPVSKRSNSTKYKYFHFQNIRCSLSARITGFEALDFQKFPKRSSFTKSQNHQLRDARNSVRTRITILEAFEFHKVPESPLSNSVRTRITILEALEFHKVPEPPLSKRSSFTKHKNHNFRAVPISLSARITGFEALAFH
jgi:hypothetical protein